MTASADVDFTATPALGRVIGALSEQFDDVQLIGDTWFSPCPCHPHTGRQLCIEESDDPRRVVVDCEQHCDIVAIATAGGFDLRDVARDGFDGDVDGEPVFASLRSLLESPTVLQPPMQIAHRLAYEGRAIAVCAPDKAGKSTLLAAAAAAVTTGRAFLGAPTCRGAVLWVGLEEALNDAVPRFAELGADPDLVDLVVAKPDNLLTKIELQLAARTYVWMVLDSVSEYARLVSRGTPPSEGDTSGWSMVARPLVQVCHRTGVALTALHHVRRDGEERGSTELFASFDAVWVMKKGKSDEEPTIRRFRGRGRRNLDVSDFEVRWDGRAYSLHGAGAAELSIDARVLLHVERAPRSSSRKLRDAIGGRASEVDRAIAELERRGAIRNDGTGTASAWVTRVQGTFGALE